MRLRDHHHAHARSAASSSGATVEDVLFLPWGPGTDDGAAAPPCEVVGAYGPIELEYAAIRRGAGVFDAAQLGVIRLTGDERLDLLDRLLTQSLKGMAPGECRNAFVLERTGRIIADLRIAHADDATFVATDVHQVGRVVETLEKAIFIEEIEVTDGRDAFHVLEVHGPQTPDVVAATAPMLSVPIATTGPGAMMLVPADDAGAAFDRATNAGDRVRGIGWFAFNMARIEAGAPVWNVDYGATNLPHETGVVDDRVSFTAGCYPGQEIVARIQSLGAPKQQLIGLHGAAETIPPAGAAVCLNANGSPGDPVGVVTSSAPSPMLGARAVAFAMVRSQAIEPGTALVTEAEGEWVPVTAGPLRFWSP